MFLLCKLSHEKIWISPHRYTIGLCHGRKKIQHFTVTIIDRPEGALENVLCYLKHICTQTMF